MKTPDAVLHCNPLLCGEYRCVVADPPWTPRLHRNTVGRKEPKNGYRKGPQGHYATMTLPEICELQPVTADKCHLWLWVLSQHIDWGYAVGYKQLLFGVSSWQYVTDATVTVKHMGVTDHLSGQGPEHIPDHAQSAKDQGSRLIVFSRSIAMLAIIQTPANLPNNAADQLRKEKTWHASFMRNGSEL